MTLNSSADIALGMQHISEALFIGLCRKVGTSEMIAMRREIQDIDEKVREPLIRVFGTLRSGSSREGFRLKGSDFDCMNWPKQYKVIWELFQTQYYNRHTLIFADCSDSPPGFALLRLLSPCIHEFFKAACIKMNGKVYISSCKSKEITCYHIRKVSGNYFFLHGPCASGVNEGEELDIACCFVSDFWPPSASSWIDRCHTWPNSHVVQEIVKGGCHFVAIGHKLGNHEDEEWRISFSLAEQKLVYEMNHSQFLVYGLLKILVKEIFHQILGDEGKLLCSYHMKTAVFWVIQQNTIPFWCPQNLLECFWVCFKLILKWVYEGVCPNFFIPENNMFLHNIYGEAQKKLFSSLFALYQRGVAFLLYSLSIRSDFIPALYNLRLNVCTNERMAISETEFDVELFSQLSTIDAGHESDLLSILQSLHIVEQLIDLPLTKYQVIMLQRYTANMLQTIAFKLHSLYLNTAVNKLVYIADKMSCYMVKLAAKFGFISDMLYIAMYYYRTLRYKEALSVIEKTKLKLARVYLMRNNQVHTESYTAAVGGESLSTKMREAVAMQIKVDSECRYINELIPEIQSSLQNGVRILHISDTIMVYMLEILCYIHINSARVQRALKHLLFIVHNELVPQQTKDISWQILGICQQVTGNRQAALFSYQHSLRKEPFHKIQTATLMRIQSLYSEF